MTLLGRTDNQMARDVRDRTGFHLFRLPTTLPTLEVNIYFAEHPVPTLIDVPPDSPPVLEKLKAGLNSVGYSLPDIKTIIVTHSHLDHCGSARTIADVSGADVWAAEGVATWLTDYDKESLDEEHFIVLTLERSGVPRELIDQSRERFRIMRQFTRSVTETRPLVAGDTLKLSSCSLVVEHVPGHTPWCIMFHDARKKIAFTGDFLLGGISPNPLIQRPWTVPGGYRSLKAYASSLVRVEGLNLKVGYPGHGELIANPTERARALLGQIRARRETILEILSRRRDQTVYDIVKRLFPQLPEGQVFLAVSEVWAHLEQLLDEGVLDEERGFPARFSSL